MKFQQPLRAFSVFSYAAPDAVSSDELDPQYNTRVVEVYKPLLQIYERMFETTRHVTAGEEIVYPCKTKPDAMIFFYSVGGRLVGSYHSHFDLEIIATLPECVCNFVAITKLENRQVFIIQASAHLDLLLESLFQHLTLTELNDPSGHKSNLYENSDGAIIYILKKHSFLINR